VNVEWTARFRRAYRKLSLPEQARCDETLRLLVRDPRYPSLVIRVQGAPDIWEGRSGEKTRLTFEWIEGGLRLRNVDDHDACLRKPVVPIRN
jgi:mRNA-degrading endonuclease RelE of RelBE toxin-antitoxin system